MKGDVHCHVWNCSSFQEDSDAVGSFSVELGLPWGAAERSSSCSQGCRILAFPLSCSPVCEVKVFAALCCTRC